MPRPGIMDGRLPNAMGAGALSPGPSSGCTRARRFRAPELRERSEELPGRYLTVTYSPRTSLCFVPSRSGSVSCRTSDFTIASVPTLYFLKWGETMCAS